MPAALTAAIVAVIDRHEPLTFCFPCLAALTEASEQAVREASQPLVAIEDWRLSLRMCARCGVEGELLERRPVP
jgi:hypothetical protein